MGRSLKIVELSIILIYSITLIDERFTCFHAKFYTNLFIYYRENIWKLPKASELRHKTINIIRLNVPSGVHKRYNTLTSVTDSMNDQTDTAWQEIWTPLVNCSTNIASHATGCSFVSKILVTETIFYSTSIAFPQLSLQLIKLDRQEELWQTWIQSKGIRVFYLT